MSRGLGDVYKRQVFILDKLARQLGGWRYQIAQKAHCPTSYSTLELEPVLVTLVLDSLPIQMPKQPVSAPIQTLTSPDWATLGSGSDINQCTA